MVLAVAMAIVVAGPARIRWAKAAQLLGGRAWLKDPSGRAEMVNCDLCCALLVTYSQRIVRCVSQSIAKFVCASDTPLLGMREVFLSHNL